MSEVADNLEAAWELYASELAALPNVSTVATGVRTTNGYPTRTPAIVVTVRRKVPPERLGPSTMCPREVRLPNGAVVDVDVIEEPEAIDTPDQDSATYRPVPGGCEIAPFGSGFLGTLGGWFCGPDEEGSGWSPVWLTNAHVADPATFSAIPADSRMVQPWAGGVIGRTTAISGWPNPLPGPNQTFVGVMDAAIGVTDDEIDEDFRVLQIGDAVYETATAQAGQNVQKRGRTTRLRTGTVPAQTGGAPWLAVNINTGNNDGSQVTFGTAGNPRIFRINSPGTGIANAFGMPGDSGALVFGQNAGEIRSTRPALGLYFAGNGRWVSQQPNPNNFTVRGFAFDIGGVMNQMQLETICNCVLRALLDAIFGRSDADSASSDSRGRVVRSAERRMRQFRGGILARSPVGRRISEAVSQTAPQVGRVLSLDPVAFGMAVDLLEPWAKEATSLRILSRRVDEETVARSVALAERIIRVCPEAEERIAPMADLMRESDGTTVRQLIGRLSVPKLPKDDDGGRRKKGR